MPSEAIDELTRLLQTDALTMVFQPIASMKDGEIFAHGRSSTSAPMRWCRR